MPLLETHVLAPEIDHATIRSIARIVSSDTGGPKRLIISGRRSIPTGTFVSLKAGARAMPWESVRCELPVLELCEVASPVFNLVAQPHRLEMRVQGQRAPLVYYPDLIIEAAADFVDDVVAGTPFALAARRWTPSNKRPGTRKLVIEVKDDLDRRNEDQEYQHKLRLAGQTYEKVGYRFVTVMRSRDIECADRRSIASIAFDRFTAIRAHDVDLVFRLIDAHRGAACFADVVEALGGGSLGRAKTFALQVRRVLSIDLRSPVEPSSCVRLVGDGRSLPRRRRR